MTRAEIDTVLGKLRKLVELGRFMERWRRGPLEDLEVARETMRAAQPKVRALTAELQAAPEPYAGWGRALTHELDVAVSCTRADGPLSALAAADRAEALLDEAAARLRWEATAD